MSGLLSSRSKRQVVLVCALAVVLVLAGCSGLSSDDPELPDGEEAAERFESVDTYNITWEQRTTFDNETTELTMKQTIRPSTGERYIETHNDGTRNITVSNGTTTWTYSPDQNEVTITQRDGGVVANQSDQIRQLVDAVETDETELQRTPILPLFTAGARSSGSSSVQTDLWTDPIQVSYEGVETVAGREAHVISMESTDDADREMKQTQYLDAEHFVVLKTSMELDGEVSDVEIEIEVENVEFNPGLDDDIFEFEIPENATVDRIGENIDQYESYDQVQRETAGHVPDPTVPGDFEFEIATVTNETVGLTYSNGTANLMVLRRESGEMSDAAREIQQNGRTYYFTEEFGTAIQWQCGEQLYSVQSFGPGDNIDREILLDVAASVECPAD